jgi:hypothetical protein
MILDRHPETWIFKSVSRAETVGKPVVRYLILGSNEHQAAGFVPSLGQKVRQFEDPEDPSNRSLLETQLA